jgi:putative iron-dependent peroxidase
MSAHQPGIFALATVEHCYVEVDLGEGCSPSDLVTALAGLAGPGSPVAGVGVVVAFRPELWRSLAPQDAPPGTRSFEEISGPELVMPASQHDAWVWIAGGARSAVFDSTLSVLGRLRGLATVATEVTGWAYQTDRDLTGFIDGTENPSILEAPDVAVVADGPGAGCSIVLIQQWVHHPSFDALSVEEQERVIGRTKADSVELDELLMPADSHVSRTVIEQDGEELAIYRRNTAYGGPNEHGTLFVGFCASQRTFELMLERMVGVGDGIRDALTRHTTPLTGAYYVAPSLPALRRFVPDES